MISVWVNATMYVFSSLRMPWECIVKVPVFLEQFFELSCPWLGLFGLDHSLPIRKESTVETVVLLHVPFIL